MKCSRIWCYSAQPHLCAKLTKSANPNSLNIWQKCKERDHNEDWCDWGTYIYKKYLITLAGVTPKKLRGYKTA